MIAQDKASVSAAGYHVELTMTQDLNVPPTCVISKVQGDTEYVLQEMNVHWSDEPDALVYLAVIKALLFHHREKKVKVDQVFEVREIGGNNRFYLVDLANPKKGLYEVFCFSNLTWRNKNVFKLLKNLTNDLLRIDSIALPLL